MPTLESWECDAVFIARSAALNKAMTWRAYLHYLECELIAAL